MTADQDHTHWFIVHTPPLQERRLQRGLREHRIDEYLPQETRWRHTRFRKAAVTKALFPGYVFIGLPADDLGFYRVSSLDGFGSFLSVGDKPYRVQFGKVERAKGQPEPFSIEALREAETLGAFDRTVSRKLTFAPGQPVRITRGLWTGFTAEVIEASSDAQRVRVLLQSILGGKPSPLKLNADQIVAA